VYRRLGPILQPLLIACWRSQPRRDADTPIDGWWRTEPPNQTGGITWRRRRRRRTRRPPACRCPSRRPARSLRQGRPCSETPKVPAPTAEPAEGAGSTANHCGQGGAGTRAQARATQQVERREADEGRLGHSRRDEGFEPERHAQGRSWTSASVAESRSTPLARSTSAGRKATSRAPPHGAP
jgi:hypothetical protein